MLKKEIVHFGKTMIAACDGNCEKAWGISSRPRTQLSDNDDDFIWKSDNELGIAPADPGTYEGGQGKPLLTSSTLEKINKWCVRECERIRLFIPGAEIKLPDTNNPSPNIKD